MEPRCIDDSLTLRVDESLTSKVAIIGAGPAGLTAAFELVRRGEKCVVLEADSQVGGISRTVERDGFRFDIGGHRFFSKSAVVRTLWREMIAPQEFLRRPRLSRILYRGKLFAYPLKPFDALRQLGPVEAFRCVASYVWARVRPPSDRSTFEGWTSAAFGKRLYEIFFKTYTEKVWGVPAVTIQADWAAQRIKSLNLARVVWDGVRPHRFTRSPRPTSLIDEFDYPALGPGQLWEQCAETVLHGGGRIVMNSPVVSIRRNDIAAFEVLYRSDDVLRSEPCSAVISSMPISELVRALDPPAPAEVLLAADGLRHRAFMTVALVVPASCGFPDNWIYVHDPSVRVGRVQNFRSWSPAMVRDGATCLGLEYFVEEGDNMWTMPDADLIALATAELAALGLARRTDVAQGYVVRMPKAYPMYDATYADNVQTIRSWIEQSVPNVIPVGRNGMHRYNNQDHSMLTALQAVENLFGAAHDLWSVNLDDDYHEEITQPSEPAGSLAARGLPRSVDTIGPRVGGRRWLRRTLPPALGQPFKSSTNEAGRPTRERQSTSEHREEVVFPQRWGEPLWRCQSLSMTVADPVEIFDERMESIVERGTSVTRLGGDGKWSEGPVYLPESDSVIWSDIPNNRILEWSATDGSVSTWRRPSNFTNGHTLDNNGRIVHCSHGARAVLRTEPDGSVSTLVSHVGSARLNSPNDVVVASDDSIWFSDPPYGILSDNEGYKADSELPGCYVFRFEPATGRLDAVVTDMIYPNGLAFSPDESILYVSDTSEAPMGEAGRHHVRAYDVVQDGQVPVVAVNSRVFAEIRPGLPDGFRVDADGNLYISSLDAIQVFAPDGTRIGRIPVPERIANCCFGGVDGHTLFITASSSLYSIRVGSTEGRRRR